MEEENVNANDQFYNLAFNTWGQEELDAIQRVVESDRFTMGPEVSRFEKEFAAYFGRRHALMVNSGSSAVLIAVASLFFKKDNPLKPGDEVIVPAISWSTTFYPLQQYGLRLRFVDVEIDTLNMDTGQLEAVLTPTTRMVVGVNILGNPADLGVLREFADAHDLYFFEDNCESMDAELKNQKTGSFGDVSTFSTFFSHHISTMEGGVLTTDDDELAQLANSLRCHGWTRGLPSDSHLFEDRRDDFFEAYRFILPGYNLRPLEMAGAVGHEQLKKLPSMTKKRRDNMKLFQNLFAGDDRFFTQRENGKSSSFCFTIVLNPSLEHPRAKVLEFLKGADIGYRIITGGCFPRHDVIKHFDYSCVGDLACANLAHDRGFFVGNHPQDLTPQITRLREVLDEACGS